jgi:hypothetical protein
MGIKYKYVTKNKKLAKFLLEKEKEKNILSDQSHLKYKTIEKNVEYVYHYGWPNIHLYAIGVYKLNNGYEISFDYCYEMDTQNIQNIKKVVYYNLNII